jgi:hypothetical protein
MGLISRRDNGRPKARAELGHRPIPTRAATRQARHSRAASDCNLSVHGTSQHPRAALRSPLRRPVGGFALVGSRLSFPPTKPLRFSGGTP